MKKSLVLAFLFMFLSHAVYAQNSSVRDNLKWDKLAAPSNENGEIEKIYFGYTRPDGKHFDIIVDLMWPIEADQFNGGDIKEVDINFDEIPDLLISLGSMSGYGNFVFEGFVWNKVKKQFVRVPNFTRLSNPEIYPLEKKIMSFDRIDDVVEVSEWKWKDGELVETDRHYEDAVNVDDSEEENLKVMQAKAVVGEWHWVDDGELPSDIHLILSLDYEEGVLYVPECTIYGSNAAFDLDCTYEDGQLVIWNMPSLSNEISSLKAKLKLNERGDLYGTFECKVGENTSKGTVTLRLKDF